MERDSRMLAPFWSSALLLLIGVVDLTTLTPLPKLLLQLFTHLIHEIIGKLSEVSVVFWLRSCSTGRCVVNFFTNPVDVVALPDAVTDAFSTQLRVSL